MTRQTARRSVVAAGALASIVWVTTAVWGADAQHSYPFQNPSLAVDARIDNLLSLMTVEEKIDFFGKTLNLARLGLHGSGAVASPPGSNGQLEGLHGIALGGPGRWGRKSPGGTGEYSGESPIPTTQFPQSAGLGETWDPQLLREVAHEEGLEARYIFQKFDRGGLILRAPNADLARDPRWGRSEESYGEDPYLVATLAAAFVKGLQGEDPKHWLTASLLKHFMANSNEDNRSGSSSNFDARLLHEYYALPFQTGMEQGGADAYMASYNAVNGIPMTASPLLRDLTVKQWNFDGLLDTDRTAVEYMVTRHKYFPDMTAAVAGALHAGVNQFLDNYEEPLREALRKNLITPADLDSNLRGVLRVLLRLGVFDPADQVGYSSIGRDGAPPPWASAASQALALRATRESIVLLKNEPAADSPPLLPLDATSLKYIAVVGPRADEVYADFYGGMPPFAVTPLRGITEKMAQDAAVLHNVVILYSAEHDAAVESARKADVAIVVIGNHPTCGARFGQCPDPTEGKEAVDRQQIELNSQQRRLVEDVLAANRRTIVVLVTSFPYAIDWLQQHAPAIVRMTHSSELEGRALADVLFGDYNPGGRLSVTWPRSLEQLPAMMDYDLRHGRTYMYFNGEPLYPFGYGLSYTKFRYSDLRVSPVKLTQSAPATVTVRVTNVGKRAGDEVVQLYVRHIDSKVERPRQQLVGFSRQFLEPGEAREVHFDLQARALAYWDAANRAWRMEPERIQVRVGSSSADVQAEQGLTVAP